MSLRSGQHCMHRGCIAIGLVHVFMYRCQLCSLLISLITCLMLPSNDKMQPELAAESFCEPNSEETSVLKSLHKGQNELMTYFPLPTGRTLSLNFRKTHICFELVIVFSCLPCSTVVLYMWGHITACDIAIMRVQAGSIWVSRVVM